MPTPHKRRERKVKYCSYCGKKCVRSLVGAETVKVLECIGYEPMYFQLASAFDEKTGKRNYAEKFTCPDYNKKKWYQIFSPHDEFIIEKVITP